MYIIHCCFHYRIVDARRVHITPVSTHLALVLVRTRRTVQFGRISFFAPTGEGPDGVAARAVAAHVLVVALVDVCRQNTYNVHNVTRRRQSVGKNASR